MKRALLAVPFLLVAACGGVAGGSGHVADATRMRARVAGKDAEKLAPQQFAAADKALKDARDAEASGDTTGAELHAERAIASYQHAIALARLARATEEDASSREALARGLEQTQRWSTARSAAQNEADDLEKQFKIAREAQLPAASGPADPDRERARLVAAQALVTQARLLCSAARLVSDKAPGLAEAEAAAAELEKRLDGKPQPAPIDAAARARAACLGSLTKAKRSGSSEADQADALLGELSTSGDPKSSAANLAPARDERGVVVTLRNVWKGEAIAPEVAASLKDLGRIAAAHPAFGVQVVLHDATAPSAAEIATNKKRGEAIAKALTDAGATSAKVKVEHAGNRAPVVDPQDTKRRDRNARVEVVFVPGA